MGTAFGASTAAQQRENQRLERERERAEKERREREEQNQLTEEQREEIKEAVCISSTDRQRRLANETLYNSSSSFSTSTRIKRSTTMNSKSR